MNPQFYPIHKNFFITRQQLLNTMNVSIGSERTRLAGTPYNIEYNVNVFPNGRSPDEAGRFLVFLQFIIPRNIQITANYIFIVGGSQQRTFEHIYKSPSSFGGILCPRDLIFYSNTLLVNERLSIELHGNVFIRKSLDFYILTKLRFPSISNTSNLLKTMPPKIVQTPHAGKTQSDIAKIQQNHIDEQKAPKKVVDVTVVKDASKLTSTNNENSTPTVTADISKEAEIIEAMKPEISVAEVPSSIHEPRPRSPEPCPNSETNKFDTEKLISEIQNSHIQNTLKKDIISTIQNLCNENQKLLQEKIELEIDLLKRLSASREKQIEFLSKVNATQEKSISQNTQSASPTSLAAINQTPVTKNVGPKFVQYGITGVVKCFSVENRCGIINYKKNNISKEVFVNSFNIIKSKIRKPHLRTLRPTESVIFDLYDSGNSKLEALNVMGPGGADVQGIYVIYRDYLQYSNTHNSSYIHLDRRSSYHQSVYNDQNYSRSYSTHQNQRKDYRYNYDVYEQDTNYRTYRR